MELAAICDSWKKGACLMAAATRSQEYENVADIIARLGAIAPERIRLHPSPGTAKVKDVIAALEAPRKRICELVDGVLVEKAMGNKESLLTVALTGFVDRYLDSLDEDLGRLLGADATMRMLPGLVRIPDLSLVSWERVGADEWPDEPVHSLVPDLAVEIISRGNTKSEMMRKLRDYFRAGVREAWLVYPKTQSIEIYTAPDKLRRISKGGTLRDSIVLPGFMLPLATLFAATRRRKKR
jgi:Uma2 family endonuclease